MRRRRDAAGIRFGSFEPPACCAPRSSAAPSAQPSDDKRPALKGEIKRARKREALERFVNRNAKVLAELAK
jgi:hypothetical protein